MTKEIFLPSFEISKREPYFFSSHLATHQKNKYELKFYEMLKASFQYPGVFISKKEKKKDLAFIDPQYFIETSSWLSYLYTKYYRKE